MAIVLNGKTYNFAGFDQNGVSLFKETSSGVPGGFSYLTCRVSDATGGANAKVVWRLTMPILAPEDSSCSCEGNVLRTYRFDDGKITIPATGTVAERTDFQARIEALTATTQYEASIVSLVQPTA